MKHKNNINLLRFVNNRRGTNSYKWDLNENIEYSFSVADMDIALSDLIIQDIKKRIDFGVFGYEYVGEGYYQSFINWINKFHGIKINKDWITVVDGVITGIKIALQAFTKKDDAVLVLTPCYHSYIDAIKTNERKLVTCNLIYNSNNYELDINQFEKLILKEKVKVFILNNPHNPTGKLFEKKELEAIQKICSRYSVLVVSDEVFEDFVVPKSEFQSFMNVSDNKCLSIIATSPCKTFNISGLKISNFMIKNYNVRKKFVNQKNKNMSERANCLSLAISESVYKLGENWLNSVISNSLINKNIVMEFMKIKHPRIKIVDSYVAYWLWIDLNELSIPESDLRKLLINNAIDISYGSMYGDIGKGFIRLNLMCSLSNINMFLETFDRIISVYIDL